MTKIIHQARMTGATIHPACEDASNWAEGVYAARKGEVAFSWHLVNCRECIDWLNASKVSIMGLCSMGKHSKCSGSAKVQGASDWKCDCSCHQGGK